MQLLVLLQDMKIAMKQQRCLQLWMQQRNNNKESKVFVNNERKGAEKFPVLQLYPEQDERYCSSFQYCKLMRNYTQGLLSDNVIVYIVHDSNNNSHCRLSLPIPMNVAFMVFKFVHNLIKHNFYAMVCWFPWQKSMHTNYKQKNCLIMQMLAYSKIVKTAHRTPIAYPRSGLTTITINH